MWNELWEQDQQQLVALEECVKHFKILTSSGMDSENSRRLWLVKIPCWKSFPANLDPAGKSFTDFPAAENAIPAKVWAFSGKENGCWAVVPEKCNSAKSVVAAHPHLQESRAELKNSSTGHMLSTSRICIEKTCKQGMFVKIKDFILNLKGFSCGIPREQAILRKSKATRKSPEKWTFLSLAFYNAPSLTTVDVNNAHMRISEGSTRRS